MVVSTKSEFDSLFSYPESQMPRSCRARIGVLRHTLFGSLGFAVGVLASGALEWLVISAH